MHRPQFLAPLLTALLVAPDGAAGGERSSSGVPDIEAGRSFWSFRAPVRPPVPTVRGGDRVRTPIDAFVLRRLEDAGLGFNPDASRRVLVRRLSFDLLGLPPDPAEIDAFVADPDAHAADRLVDRLLASPHHGERWGRHWLDVAGFAESSLFIGDQRRPGFWRYRDYVIRALNADMPYDRFVTEQLAGDELFDWRSVESFDEEHIAKLVATGFLRCPPDATDNQPITQGEKIFAAQQAVVEVSMKALIGLTLNCVRCHSHKYDPIPHEDYYRLVAVFQPAYDPERWLAGIWNQGNPGPVRAVPILDRDEREEFFRRSRAWGEERLALVAKLEGSDAEETRRIRERFEEIRKEVGELPPLIWGLFDVSTDPSPTRLLERGNHETPSREVAPGVLSVLDDPDDPFRAPEPEAGASTTGRRLALARWLTRRDHPLTARVIVNRIWQYHFGRGLVETPDDFGARGRAPSHPELLDWLAVELVESGWSLKHIHRLILDSTTYRQAAGVDERRQRIDPSNRLLGSFPRRRIEAEALRDAMLAASGLLDTRLHGPSVPTARRPDGRFVVPSDHPDRHRRSVYLSTRRTWVATFLTTFDAPVMDTNCPRRASAAIPQQALALMNNPFTIECAAAFAGRALAEGDETIDDRLRRAWILAFGRAPEHDEAAPFRRLVAAAVGSTEEEAERRAWRTVCHALLSASEFLYVD